MSISHCIRHFSLYEATPLVEGGETMDIGDLYLYLLYLWVKPTSNPRKLVLDVRRTGTDVQSG